MRLRFPTPVLRAARSRSTFCAILPPYRPVELLGYLSNVQRVDSHTIRYVGRDIADVSRFLEFITRYDPTLSP